METLVIHTEDDEQSKTIKAILKALKVKVEVFSETSVLNEALPSYITKLMEKSLKEAEEKQLTSHVAFMEQVKAKLKK